MMLLEIIALVACGVGGVLATHDGKFYIRLAGLCIFAGGITTSNIMVALKKPTVVYAEYIQIATEKCGKFNEFKSIGYVKYTKQYTVTCANGDTFTFSKVEK